MLPILTAGQIREADAYTIANEPVASLDLMERAGLAFVNRFIAYFPQKKTGISVYCGTGNNGGDGLVIARLLVAQGYTGIKVTIARFSRKTSAEFNANFDRIKQAGIAYIELSSAKNLRVDDTPVIIDALLGTGLNKPLTGDYANLVNHLNHQHKTVVAVDVPTGLFTDSEMPKDILVLKANRVIAFQQPKLNFLLPESGPHILDWDVVDIGLDANFISSLQSPYQFFEKDDIRQMLVPRPRFSNKGAFGHALIIAGQTETMGAALLSASACAHAGAGLTTACVPQAGLTALNSYLPEVMAIVRDSKPKPNIPWDKFTTVAIGPGLGKEKDAEGLLKAVFKNFDKPIVVDADALNLLSANKKLLKHLPAGSIITPHMKEFDRLFGEHPSWRARLETAQAKAAEHQINILLKNTYTIIATPTGKVYFNSTSNPAMASGGMGDVLTGIIAALLAQKYLPEQACIIGAYIHGLAGDQLALPTKMHVILPGKIIQQLPYTLAGLMP